MTDLRASEDAPAIILPPTAPKVRITAGLGSVQQRTWILRRPVTLIGTSRLAHIVLTDEAVSRAHSLFVNTGREVLVKDLYSTAGTWRNDQRVDLAVLSDGDVLRLGETHIQVAIQAPGPPSGATAAVGRYPDPLTLHEPLLLRGFDTFEHWQVESAVAIIGSRPGVSVQLQHSDISPVHAALVSLDGRPAVFDLVSGAGTWVNGRSVTLALLNAGDRLRIGPYEMIVGGATDAAWSGHDSAGSVPPSAAEASSFQPGETDRLHPPAGELARRARELDRWERQLRQETAALEAVRITLEATRAGVENDRRALQQQALALWKARQKNAETSKRRNVETPNRRTAETPDV